MGYTWHYFDGSSGEDWPDAEKFVNGNVNDYASGSTLEAWICADLDANEPRVAAIRIKSRGFKPPADSVAVTVDIQYTSQEPADWQAWENDVLLAANGWKTFKFDSPITLRAIQMMIENLNTATVLYAYEVQWASVAPRYHYEKMERGQ